MVCSQGIPQLDDAEVQRPGMVPVLHRKLQQGHLTHSSSSLFAAQAAHSSPPSAQTSWSQRYCSPPHLGHTSTGRACWMSRSGGYGPRLRRTIWISPLFGKFFLSPLKIILDKSRDVCYSIPCCWTAILTSAGVAQPVEQLICNQQVGGSNPSTSSTISYGGVPEWPKGADCKSVAFRFGGSNPPSSTTWPQSSLCGHVFYP